MAALDDPVAPTNKHTMRRLAAKVAVWLAVLVLGTLALAKFANVSAVSAWLGFVGSVTLSLPAIRLLLRLRADAREIRQAQRLPSNQAVPFAIHLDGLSKARPATYSALDALTYAVGMLLVAAGFILQVIGALLAAPA